MTEHIPIAEQFYSMQGEGPYAGYPSVFLRTAGCNLVCGGGENLEVENQEDMEPSDDATWVCDTISVWREADEKPTVEEVVDEWAERGWLDKFRQGAHLVVTGGEPTLPKRQDQLCALFDELDDRHALPFIEIETNGTQWVGFKFDGMIDHYNVSLKLSNSGMSRSQRIRDKSIDWFIRRHESDEMGGAILKFVVSRDEDVEEIEDLISEFDVPTDMVWLMPAGASQDQLRETYPTVAEMCKEEGYKFSPRLQVDTWAQATGV